MENIIKTAFGPFGGIEKFSKGLEQKYGIQLKESHPKAPLFALSKECIKKVGLFDEYNSPVGLHEDADFCHRVTRGGFKIGRAEGSFAMHFSMMSRTKNEFKKSDWVEGREKAFTEKWGVSSKKMDKIPVDKKFRLDIGSGERPKREDGKHWYHMDIDKQFSDVEYLQKIDEEFPFEDGEIEEIYASNCLEHVEHRRILSTLYEWFRVLKQGGKAEIRVPNFEFAAKRYLEGSWTLSLEEGVDFNLTHLIFGGDHEGCPHVHKVGLDFKNLSKALKDVGFQNVENISDPNSWELKVLAEK
jgi:predicted SAM-dependent methyltransferase